MKTLLIALCLTLSLSVSLSASASTLDGYSIPLISNDPEVNFVLNTIQTRTEYKNETVAKTCYRTVQDGYRNHCEYYPEVVCHEDRHSRRICTTHNVYRCHSEPVYRQVPYTCYETVRVPYEVFNYNVKANVNVKKSTMVSTNNSCELLFTLEGQSLRANTACAELIVLARKTSTERREGSTVIQDHNYVLDLLNAADIAAPVDGGIVDMRLEGQHLVFRTGDLTRNSNFSLKLSVERKKFLKNDVVLINRNLTSTEYSFEKLNDRYGIVKINLASLIGSVDVKKKHVFRVNLDVKLDRSSILNNPLPVLSADSSLTVND